MNSLIDIQAQIQRLQKQADQIKAKEFEKTIHEIREKMLAFGITPKDLLMTKEGKRGPNSYKKQQERVNASQKKTTSRLVAAKYRGPDGQTWSGRGLTPRWLKALIAQGRKKEEFAITS
ncbi:MULTISPECIES: H-NS histone family protein [Polaromonas]|uniref:H-NS family nucleoid-associated regulatory protein n=1 Tax=Polaromonas aquatica TaxID=332657 RepID=A0ABW1U2G6_9BURK